MKKLSSKSLKTETKPLFRFKNVDTKIKFWCLQTTIDDTTVSLDTTTATITTTTH